jgi:uncharacterized protein YnzC (UPF0291/DUF896 family)
MKKLSKTSMLDIIIKLNKIIKLHKTGNLIKKNKKELRTLIYDYISYIKNETRNSIIKYISQNIYVLENNDILNYSVREGILYKTIEIKENLKESISKTYNLEIVKITLLADDELLKLYNEFLKISSMKSIDERIVNVLENNNLLHLLH